MPALTSPLPVRPHCVRFRAPVSHGSRAHVWRPSRRSSLTVGVAAQLDLPDPDAFKWHFPKEFHAETTFNESNIYPQRAPDDGGAKGRVWIDNRWITPCAPPLPPAAFMYAAYPPRPLARYSPYSLLKYHCHLNVEVYSATSSACCMQGQKGHGDVVY